jgi:hypothetical protein
LFAAFVEKGAAGAVGLEQAGRRLAGEFAETHLAALEFGLGPRQALQILAKLARLLLEQGFAAHRLGHVAHLEQAVTLPSVSTGVTSMDCSMRSPRSPPG